MGSSKNSDLIAQAQEWIDHDPDLETRSELLGLLKANNTEELDDRFSRRLTFGTAGIRGTQGGGPSSLLRCPPKISRYGNHDYRITQPSYR